MYVIIYIVGDSMNNKGFTMVELLVSMAIMGLLIIMAFPTIRAIQTNNTSTRYEEYGKSVISASKIYVDSYGEDLFDPEINNQTRIVDLESLVKKDLLKDINLSDSTCINGQSNVRVVKYKDDYAYCLNLICKAGDKVVYTEKNKKGSCKDIDARIRTVTYKYKDYPAYTTEVLVGDDNYMLLDPSRMNFNFSANKETFKGWTLDSNPTNSSTTYPKGSIYPKTINDNITFYAYGQKWKYKINYKKNSDGTYNGTMNSKTCTYGDNCFLDPILFTRTGYHFIQWQKDSSTKYNDKENVKDKIGSSITKDGEQINLTAIFSINKCTVTYHANGGVFTKNNHVLVNPPITTDTQMLPYGTYFGGTGSMRDASGGYYAAERTGYTVISASAWTNGNKTFDETKRYLAQDVCDLSKGDNSTTLKVNWQPREYTVKINSNFNGISKIYLGDKSSTNKVITKKVKHGETITIKANKKDYYKFLGWKNSKGEVVYKNLKNTIKVTSNLDLTAKGRLSKIYLVYYYNGGTLKKGKRQICTKIAGCKSTADCDNYPNQKSGCTKDECKDGKTCYKTPGADDYGYDEGWSTEGLRNYSKKDGATLYLTRVDTKNGKKIEYKPTGYWHVGKPGGSPKIKEGKTFSKNNTGLDLLKNCQTEGSNTYVNKLKDDDVTVRLYAGWKKK